LTVPELSGLSVNMFNV